VWRAIDRDEEFEENTLCRCNDVFVVFKGLVGEGRQAIEKDGFCYRLPGGYNVSFTLCYNLC